MLWGPVSSDREISDINWQNRKKRVASLHCLETSQQFELTFIHLCTSFLATSQASLGSCVSCKHRYSATFHRMTDPGIQLYEPRTARTAPRYQHQPGPVQCWRLYERREISSSIAPSLQNKISVNLPWPKHLWYPKIMSAHWGQSVGPVPYFVENFRQWYHMIEVRIITTIGCI